MLAMRVFVFVRQSLIVRCVLLLAFLAMAATESDAQSLTVNGQIVQGSYTNGAPAFVSYSGATVGQYACVSLTTSSPDPHFIPEVGLPGDLQIGSRYGSRSCVKIIAASGQIEISNYANPAYRGAFGYTIQLSEPTLPYAGGGGVAVSGVTNSGSISGTNVDLWTFTASKDDIFRIQFPTTNLQNCTSDFCAQTILVNPDGTVDFESGSGGTPGGITYIAPQSGTYYLFVYSQISYLGPTSGSYTFSINIQSHAPNAAPTVTLLDPITIDARQSLLSGNAITTDKSKLSQGGSVIGGTAADGAAELVIRIAAASLGEQFTITQSGGDGFLGAVGSAPTSQGNVSVTADYTSSVDHTPYAFALFRAPLNFVRQGYLGDSGVAYRSVTLTVTPTVGSGAPASVPIIIWRPPLVLIHGLWSSPAAWKNFDPLVTVSSGGMQTFDSRFDGYFVDYAATAGNSVSSIVSMQQGALSQLTDAIKSFKAKHQAAAIQADVVAHSMGGLVARDMALSPAFVLNTLGKGSIHRLITIGTPHAGTPIAGRLLNSSFLCKAALGAAGSPVAGAVIDLQPNSALINSLSTSTVPLSAHLLAGIADPSQEDASEAGLLAVGIFASSGAHTNICLGILPPGGYQALYGGNSDLLVPLDSQLNGVGVSGFGEFFVSTIHTIKAVIFPQGPDELNRDSVDLLGLQTRSANSQIPDRVIDLLNASAAQVLFTDINP